MALPQFQHRYAFKQLVNSRHVLYFLTIHFSCFCKDTIKQLVQFILLLRCKDTKNPTHDDMNGMILREIRKYLRTKSSLGVTNIVKMCQEPVPCHLNLEVSALNMSGICPRGIVEDVSVICSFDILLVISQAKTISFFSQLPSFYAVRFKFSLKRF